MIERIVKPLSKWMIDNAGFTAKDSEEEKWKHVFNKDLQTSGINKPWKGYLNWDLVSQEFEESNVEYLPKLEVS